MSRDRTLAHDEPLLRLKIATRKAVKGVHGTALAAEISGSRQQRMSDCQVPNTPDFLRLDEVHAIEEAGKGAPDWPPLTRAMARNHGFALLPLPDAGAIIGDSEWHAAIAAVSRETGEVVARVCGALSDGKVTPDEVRRDHILEEIDQGIASLARMRALAEAAARPEKDR